MKMKKNMFGQQLNISHNSLAFRSHVTNKWVCDHTLVSFDIKGIKKAYKMKAEEIKTQGPNQNQEDAEEEKVKENKAKVRFA